MQETEWKSRVFQAWLQNDQDELARLRSLLDWDGIGRSLREEATTSQQPAQPKIRTAEETHPTYQHNYKNGICILKGCGAKLEDDPIASATYRAIIRTASEAIAEMEAEQPAAPQEGQQAKPQSKVGQYISCQTCHKPAGDQATKESGTCQDCKGRIIREGRQREANRANLRAHLAANS